MAKCRSFTPEPQTSGASTPSTATPAASARSWMPPASSTPSAGGSAPTSARTRVPTPPPPRTVPPSGVSWAPPIATPPVPALPFTRQPSPRVRHSSPPARASPQASSRALAPVPCAFAAPQVQRLPRPDCDPERYSAGVEVTIGVYHFRCLEVLGRGSFGEVWSAEILAGQERRQDAALKDIVARDQQAVDQALFEIKLLAELGGDACTPRLLAQHIAGQRIRIAMTRVPGETLGDWISRPQPSNQDGPGAIRRGGALATLLLRQLGPTLERVSRLAWHRDVNPRNVLISDGSTGGLLESTKASVSSARFWLIDFGLAVDSRTWGAKWATSPISGDCRYWPVSSWLMWLQGPEAVRRSRRMVLQYETKLDSYALGIMALELLCTPALASLDQAKTGSEDELRGSWRRLLTAYSKYMRDVSRWHRELFHVFSTGADIGPLYQKLSQERAVEVVHERVTTVRGCLRACVERTHDPAIQNLLWAVAELLDESSSVVLMEAVRAVWSDGRYQPGSHSTVAVPAAELEQSAAELEPGPAWMQTSLASFAPARRSATPQRRERSESAHRSQQPQHAAYMRSKGRPVPEQPFFQRPTSFDGSQLVSQQPFFQPPMAQSQQASFVPSGEASFVPPAVPPLCFAPPPMANGAGRRQPSPSPAVVTHHRGGFVTASARGFDERGSAR